MNSLMDPIEEVALPHPRPLPTEPHPALMENEVALAVEDYKKRNRMIARIIVYGFMLVGLGFGALVLLARTRFTAC